MLQRRKMTQNRKNRKKRSQTLRNRQMTQKRSPKKFNLRQRRKTPLKIQRAAAPAQSLKIKRKKNLPSK